ncbi:S41 family peptidase [Ruminococcus sp.]|uniref:S41 family peptidase n=1 Tax=Ruminococcus sp. TaxID=41978 RepID=UPI003F0B8CA9
MKKLSVKKICAVVLSAVLLTSTISGLTVSAAEETPLILGDANLDGSISVADATEIQKYLAESANFGIKQEVVSNVDNTEININSVTLIQKYLSGYDTELSIGQAVDEGEDGIIVKKEVTKYFSEDDGGVSEEALDTYFSTKYDDIPFLSVDFCMPFFSDFYGQSELTSETSDDGNVVTYSNEDGATVEFNYTEKYIEFNDYDLFLSLEDYSPLETLTPFASVATSDEPTILLQSPYDHYYSGDTRRIKLDDYLIPMIKSGNKLCIPVATFNDIFISETGYNLVYNGKALFCTASSLLNGKLGEIYYSVDSKDSISEDLARFNYYELCLNLDLRYGLKEAHQIKDFDSYLSRMGLKTEYLSGDVLRIERANQKLYINCFADFHSALLNKSPYLDKGSSLSNNMYEYNKDFYDRLNSIMQSTNARNEKLGEVEPYERRGNTVFITFDEFTMKSAVDMYYTDNYEYVLTDTIDLFAYAVKRLQNEDSDAENVVIDVSCNGGGYNVACAYAVDAIMGQSNIVIRNPNTNALRQTITDADLNLDGKIDENDISMKELGKNIAVIVSDASFSCGNLLPCNLKSRDKDVLILGQQSGGGGCVVGYGATATGSFLQFSSTKQFTTMKNGYIKDIDDGITPDISLSLSRMYNRDYISNLVSEYFGD